MTTSERIERHLVDLYGAKRADDLLRSVQEICLKYEGKIRAPGYPDFTERDVFLITYPDQVREPGTPSLVSLTEFLRGFAADLISGIHLLPFFPASSDDGFSVIDYRAVAPAFGGWEDLERLGKTFRLMYDAVINHVSSRSAWFQQFLDGDPRYSDYFIQIEPEVDLSAVIRPRETPLLTRFSTRKGERDVWTTFGPDQIDLNYRTPEVLLELLDLLLFYASRGANWIRLDAVAYLWKEAGTPCIHLPQTHAIVQLLRATLDQAAPHVSLLTETNVPQPENLEYFGDGTDEAQLVYNFALPALVLHAFQTAQADTLAHWAASLKLPTENVTFFNILASHDGIGLNPIQGILSPDEIQDLIARVQINGGLVSSKRDTNGRASPYEINANYFDAIQDALAHEPIDLQIQRFLTAHAILLSLQGIPALYFHSLFGSRGWAAGPVETGQKRSINREKFGRMQLEQELREAGSLRAQIYSGLRRLIMVRRENAGFATRSAQQILNVDRAVFALARGQGSPAGAVVCIHNVSGRELVLDWRAVGVDPSLPGVYHELISGRQLHPRESPGIRLAGYQAMWLTS